IACKLVAVKVITWRVFSDDGSMRVELCLINQLACLVRQTTAVSEMIWVYPVELRIIRPQRNQLSAGCVNILTVGTKIHVLFKQRFAEDTRPKISQCSAVIRVLYPVAVTIVIINRQAAACL